MQEKTLRYFLQIAYLGTQYCGWQKQPNAITIQDVLEACLSQILKSNVKVVGSSRTDTGVHAQQQFAHVDLASEVAIERLQYQLNGVLPSDIAIVGIRPVESTAHARYDALARTYEYSIVPRKNPFYQKTGYWFRGTLDVAKMNEAAAILCRKRDFKSLCRVRTDDEHFLCTITEASWWVHKEHLVFRVKANRFLRSMVRIIVSLLLKIGQKKMSISDFEAYIDRQERDLAIGLVTARGLALAEVVYPSSIFLPNHT